MPTNYPGNLDALTNPTAANSLSSPSHAGQHTNVNDAIEAIQAELGLSPSAAFATVKARLDAIEARLDEIETVTPPPGGNIYYMSPTGNNANAGTISAPWATVLYASAQLEPGDTLYARGGTYLQSQGGYNWRASAGAASGTVLAPITFAAYPGEQPLFDAGATPYAGNALILSGVSWIIVDNIDITRYTTASGDGAILVYEAAHDIIIRNCHIYSNGATAQQDHPIYINGSAGNCYNIRVENCELGPSPGGGVHVYHGSSYDIDVVGCYMHDNYWAVVSGSTTHDIRVSGCTFASNTTNLARTESSYAFTATGNTPNNTIQGGSNP